MKQNRRSPDRRTPFRLFGLAIAGVAILACLASRATADEPSDGASVATDNQAPTLFAIPPQALETALDAYSAATGVQVFYNSRLAVGKVSRGVRGTYSPEAALHMLLDGTALAPFTTTQGAITLYMTEQESLFASASPIKAPTLPLGFMDVQTSNPGNYLLYADTLRFAIQTAVQRQIADRSFALAMNVWVTPSGTIQHSEVHVSTGDRYLDRTVALIVRNMSVDEAPPTGLPQPVHVRIVAQGQR